MKYYGWYSFVVAIAYWLWESSYFGWNAIPQSGAEMACDGIALFMLIVAIRYIAVDHRSAQGNS